MPPRPDSQTYTRFLLSAGVFLVIAAFVGPGLVLRETDVLRISAQELSAATAVGREELERRQRIARDVGEAASFAAGGLFVFGAALIGIAVPRLRRQELRDDERSSIELDKLRAEVEPQSEAERQERLAEDAAASGLSSTDEGKQKRTASKGGAATGFGEAWRRAADAHDRVLARLAEIAPPDYEVQPEVKIAATGRRLLLDGLLVSRTDKPDVIVEIKLLSSGAAANMTKRVLQAMNQLASYRSQFPARNAVGWLILVLDKPLSADERDRLTSLVSERREPVYVSLVDWDDLYSLRLPSF